MTACRIIFRLRTVIAASSVALVSLPCAAQSFNCPAVFPSRALQLSPAADGWVSGTGDEAHYYSADVFDGPPEQRASLQPDSSSRNSSTWRFEGPFPRGLWIQCTYAEGALTLTRRLPTVPAACVALYPKMSKGRPVSVSFDCH